jgi:hypothetical protein
MSALLNKYIVRMILFSTRESVSLDTIVVVHELIDFTAH